VNDDDGFFPATRDRELATNDLQIFHEEFVGLPGLSEPTEIDEPKHPRLIIGMGLLLATVGITLALLVVLA
jgi:hypothetical protein